MDYLLDTQAIIWSLEDDPRLPKVVSEIIEDAENSVCITAVSLWEIAIKRSIGKLTLTTALSDIQQNITTKQVRILPITTAHLETVEKLPYQDKHRDPFDRLIISQAIRSEDMILISNDPHFANYPVKLLW